MAILATSPNTEANRNYGGAYDQWLVGGEDISGGQETPDSNLDAGENSGVGNFAGYQEFRVINPDLSPIAAGATINSATLRLYGLTMAGAPTVYAYEYLRAFNRTQMTYNSHSTGNAFATAGARGSGTDISASAESSVAVPGSDQYFQLTVTNIIDAIVNGSAEAICIHADALGGNNGFIPIARYDEADGTRFELIIDYTPPGGGEDRQATLLIRDANGNPIVSTNFEIVVLDDALPITEIIAQQTIQTDASGYALVDSQSLPAVGSTTWFAYRESSESDPEIAFSVFPVSVFDANA